MTDNPVFDPSTIDWDKAHEYAAVRTAGDLIQGELDRVYGLSLRTGERIRYNNPVCHHLINIRQELKLREQVLYKEAYVLPKEKKREEASQSGSSSETSPDFPGREPEGS